MNNELITNMYRLREMMLDVSDQLKYYGGLNEEMTKQSNELYGAAKIINDWINNSLTK